MNITEDGMGGECGGCERATKNLIEGMCNVCRRKLGSNSSCGKNSNARCFPIGECPAKENCMWHSDHKLPW